jgi:hypothetical protein
MADKCTEELPGSIVESFVLAIELVGSEVKKSPDTIAKILKNPEVEKKIKEALEKRLGELQKKATLEGKPIDADQALSEIKSVFTVDTLDATKGELKKQLENNPKFRQLKSSLEGLSCKFKKAPVGFFYDEAEGVLLILTVGVMLAGAVGMYIAKTGDLDTPLSLASMLAEAPSITVLGKVDLSLADVVLKPSEKKYDAGLSAKLKDLKAIKEAELKVVVQTKNEKVAAVPISVETQVQVTPQWFGKFGASYEPLKQNIGFSLGITGKFDSIEVQVKGNYASEEKKLSYGASGGVDWKPAAAVPIKISGGVGATRTEEILNNSFTGIDYKKSQTDIKVNVGLKVEF